MEKQTVRINLIDEGATLSSMSQDGWKLVSKSDWNTDKSEYTGTFQRDENKNRTLLNG